MSNPCTVKLDLIRSRMAARNTTQAALAADCEVDVRTLQRWLAGQRVSLTQAERVASALGVGTAEVFSGVPEENAGAISARLRLVQRLLSARDSAFAQGFRLVQEHFDNVLQSVSFAGHPARGFVARQPISADVKHGFVAFRVACSAERAEMAVRCQLGRRFGYVRARLRLQGRRACLVEVFQTNSMVASRAQDGSVNLWFWVGAEHREVVFVSDRELSVSPCATSSQQLLHLDGQTTEHVLCVRPNAVHLRAAGLPLGFDRVTGAREGRVDVPIVWDALFDGPHTSVP